MHYNINVQFEKLTRYYFENKLCEENLKKLIDLAKDKHNKEGNGTTGSVLIENAFKSAQFLEKFDLSKERINEMFSKYSNSFVLNTIEKEIKILLFLKREDLIAKENVVMNFGYENFICFFIYLKSKGIKFSDISNLLEECGQCEKHLEEAFDYKKNNPNEYKKSEANLLMMIKTKKVENLENKK